MGKTDRRDLNRVKRTQSIEFKTSEECQKVLEVLDVLDKDASSRGRTPVSHTGN